MAPAVVRGRHLVYGAERLDEVRLVVEAGLDMIVGRRDSRSRSPVFDQNYEVIRLGGDGRA